MNEKNLSKFLLLQHINPFLFLMENITLKLMVLLWDPLRVHHLLMLFCVNFEKKWLSECPVEFLPNVYKRYVDDIFVTINSYSQLLKFVDYMNHQHRNTKFTFEVEKNYNFSFLDVKICRESNKSATSVFRKPTFSGVFTNFNSFIPISYKHV